MMKVEGRNQSKPGSLQEVALRARENDRSYGMEVLQDFLQQRHSQMAKEQMKWKMECQGKRSHTEEGVFCNE